MKTVENQQFTADDAIRQKASELVPVQTMDVDEFSRWRAAERRKIVIRRVRVFVGLSAISLAASLGWWLYDRRLGYLPDIQTIEHEIKVWALTERPGIIRGRPCTEVPFTDDASKHGRACFSVFLDNHQNTIAFAASVFRAVPPDLTTEKQVQEWVLGDLDDRSSLVAIGKFFDRFIGCPAAQEPPFGVEPIYLSGRWHRDSSKTTTYHRFTIETLSSIRTLEKNAQPESFTVTWIIKSRNW